MSLGLSPPLAEHRGSGKLPRWRAGRAPQVFGLILGVRGVKLVDLRSCMPRRGRQATGQCRKVLWTFTGSTSALLRAISNQNGPKKVPKSPKVLEPMENPCQPEADRPHKPPIESLDRLGPFSSSNTLARRQPRLLFRDVVAQEAHAVRRHLLSQRFPGQNERNQARSK